MSPMMQQLASICLSAVAFVKMYREIIDASDLFLGLYKISGCIHLAQAIDCPNPDKRTYGHPNKLTKLLCHEKVAALKNLMLALNVQFF